MLCCYHVSHFLEVLFQVLLEVFTDHPLLHCSHWLKNLQVMLRALKALTEVVYGRSNIQVNCRILEVLLSHMEVDVKTWAAHYPGHPALPQRAQRLQEQITCKTGARSGPML